MLSLSTRTSSVAVASVTGFSRPGLEKSLLSPMVEVGYLGAGEMGLIIHSCCGVISGCSMYAKVSDKNMMGIAIPSIVAQKEYVE